MKDALVALLLVAGVAATAISCAGVALVDGALNRLHYTGPSIIAAVALAAALLVREGFSLIADRGIALAVIVGVTSPVIVQAIGRAARARERGSVDATASDVERVE